MASTNKQAQRVFEGKVVIVTGSSAGIGQAAAVMFGREGAAGLVIHGQSLERLQHTQDMLIQEGLDASKVVQVLGSMEEEETPRKLFSNAMERFGRIDVLVNNASTLLKPSCADGNSAENLQYLY